MNEKRRSLKHPTVAGVVEDLLGCKWTMRILGLVREGIQRPGAMERAVPGLSAKVLNERLVKLTRFGVLEKRSYGEVPPRVEYHLTAFGGRLVAILDQIAALEREWPTPAPSGDAAQASDDAGRLA
jgi:DNA-binding HxlR family transcriptional regulator